MYDVLVLAIALSMDAFAVSIGLASKQKRTWLALALKAGCYFGGFQMVMSAMGYLGSMGLMHYIARIDHWIAFTLLLIIGIKMVYESFGEGTQNDFKKLTHRIFLMLALATSVDAMAAGFSLKLFDVEIFWSLGIIGITTFCLSFLGVYLGHKGGQHFEKGAERMGGMILIAIGVKILWEDYMKSLF